MARYAQHIKTVFIEYRIQNRRQQSNVIIVMLNVILVLERLTRVCTKPRLTRHIQAIDQRFGSG